jgi:hypothetical protein
MQNREHIKDRMIKTAARLWGHPEDETGTSFDPLVNILFSACALELEKISNEVEASRARLLERMVQLLSPDTLCGPLPAHTVLHARPVDGTAQLLDKDQFFLTQKTLASWQSSQAGVKDFFFAPTANFTLNASAVKYLATGHQLFRYRDMISKETIAHCLPGKELAASTLWIGISGNITNLHQTQSYFDIKNEVNRELFYHHLPLSRWFMGEERIQVQPGYNKEAISGQHLDIEQILKGRSNVSFRMKEHINAFYHHKFLTIQDNQHRDQIPTPAELLQAFDKKELQFLQQEKITWLRISFPENIPNTLLQDVLCQVNCFPAMNRQLHELSYRMQEIINILPLQGPDSFFDLHEIIDQEGVQYHSRELHNVDKEKLSLVLRQGGVGRFDERDASTIIENIIQLLNDESAAFAVLGREFLGGEMKQLQQIIYKLEQQLSSKQLHRESTPFLVLRHTGNEKVNNLLVTWWSTAGAQANEIRAGSALQAYKTGSLFHQSITVLSSVSGGRDRLSASESVTAYRSALLSRDRLVTLEDIRVFCQLQLGGRAAAVDVNKGVMVSTEVNKGFSRTIDITIRLNRNDYLDAKDKEELAFIREDLVLQLTRKSASLTPFRVFIEQVA